MAQLRVFISSTVYDLKHIRASLELFIESLGYIAVLSEMGGVPYVPDQGLDESCYQEVKTCDMYILIIGGRYGAESYRTDKGKSYAFYDEYTSVTRMEYRAALEQNLPIYIMIDKAVDVEYKLFVKNRDSKKIQYVHTDSVNIFHFIEEVRTPSKAHPVQPFERYIEIEEWLRGQWAGSFREFLQRRSTQKRLGTLEAQVKKLTNLNDTLRIYVERLLKNELSLDEAENLIRDESARLEEAALSDSSFLISNFLYNRGEPETVFLEIAKRSSPELEGGTILRVLDLEERRIMGTFMVQIIAKDHYGVRSVEGVDPIWLGYMRERGTGPVEPNLVAVYIREEAT